MEAYQLLIKLDDSTPSVWRRFVVPSDIRLDNLHLVCQVVMGWDDTHMHQFTAKKKRYGILIEDDFFQNDMQDECEFVLSDLIDRKRSKLIYEYDFGDCWIHTIVLEKKFDLSDKSQALQCIEGEYSCPPEDVGGVWGYAQFLEYYFDESHPEYEDARQWIGDDFDPTYFDIKSVNKKLSELEKEII